MSRIPLMSEDIIAEKLKVVRYDKTIPNKYRFWAIAADVKTNPMELAEEALYLLPFDDNVPKSVLDLIEYIYEAEIDRGSDEAKCCMGDMYYNGRGFERNCEKAVTYYKDAEEQGYSLGAERLGYCYFYGDGVERDYEKAYKYFVKGAFDNLIPSTYKLGDMYRDGLYVEQDKGEAYRLYKRAYDLLSEKNNYNGADVCMRLAELFYKGDSPGAGLDLHKALYFAQRAEREFEIRAESENSYVLNYMFRMRELQNKIREELDEKFKSRSEQQKGV